MGSVSAEQAALEAARLTAVRREPFRWDIILGLRYAIVQGLATAAVSIDGVISVGSAYLREAHVVEVAETLVHESEHWKCRHFARLKALNAIGDPDGNLAADLAINGRMRVEGWPRKDRPCPQDMGMPVGRELEWYYLEIKRRRQEGDPSLPPPPELDEDGRAPSMEGSGACGCGAGMPVQGEPDPDSEGDGDGDGDGDSAKDRGAKPKGLTASEAEALRAQHHERILNAAPGTVPGYMRAEAEAALLPPQVPWDRKLARAAKRGYRYQTGRDTSTYSRQSIMQAGVGMGPGRPRLPGAHSPVPDITMIIDTSGSMREQDMMAGPNEAVSILRTCGRLTVIACDTEIHEVEEVTKARQIAHLFKGRGGTDLTPAFEHVARMKRKPHVCVVVTDGGLWEFPDRMPPGICWIWLWTRPGGFERIPKGLGEVIEYRPT